MYLNTNRERAAQTFPYDRCNTDTPGVTGYRAEEAHEKSQRFPWCLALAPIPRVERGSCSAKEEVNTFLGALRQCPSPERRGTDALPRKKSTPSLMPCISARPQRGEGQMLCKEEVNTFLDALRQHPPPEWRGAAAQPRKKSTPSLMPCVSARPQRGEGQMLSQGRNQHLP